MPTTIAKANERVEISDKLLQKENDIVALFKENKKAGKIYVGIIEKAVKGINNGIKLFLTDLVTDVSYCADQQKSINRYALGNIPLKSDFDSRLVQYMHEKSRDFGFFERGEGYESRDEYESPLTEAYIAEGIVSGIRAALKLKDDCTRRHLDATSINAVAIARGLGLRESQVSEIRKSAHLHDIGKISIDAGVLKKPGKLTNEEREDMMHHPDYGANIMNVLMPEESEVSFTTMNHHKKYSEIKEIVKDEGLLMNHGITTIADSWDAMMSDRPYRKKQPFSYGMLELRRFAGTQFNPALVDEIIGRKILHPKNIQRYVS